jgi:hypothetical protein
VSLIYPATYTRDAVYACDLEEQGIFQWSQVRILFDWNVRSSFAESHQQPAHLVRGALHKGYSDHPGQLLPL